MRLEQIPEWVQNILAAAAGWSGSMVSHHILERRKRKSENQKSSIDAAEATSSFFAKTLENREITIEAAYKRLQSLEAEVLRLIESEANLRQKLVEKEAEIRNMKNQS